VGRTPDDGLPATGGAVGSHAGLHGRGLQGHLLPEVLGQILQQSGFEMEVPEDL